MHRDQMKLPNAATEEELYRGSRRPPPLKVTKHALKKSYRQPVVLPPPPTSHGRPQPVVITYLRSPKVHRVEPRDFMRVVQQLTGNDSASSRSSSETTNRPDYHHIINGADHEATSRTKRLILPGDHQGAETEEAIEWYLINMFDTSH